MARKCVVMGKKPGFGNNVSHSHRRTRRRFDVNMQTKRYWVPKLNRMLTLRLSAKAIKTIDKKGVDAVVRRLIAEGKL